jgi:hypothetical protein
LKKRHQNNQNILIQYSQQKYTCNIDLARKRKSVSDGLLQELAWLHVAVEQHVVVMKQCCVNSMSSCKQRKEKSDLLQVSFGAYAKV